MDRDDHAPALINPPKLATALPFDAAFATLPGVVRTQVLIRGELMRQIGAAKKVLPACRELALQHAGRRGMSAERLSDLYYEFRRIGAAALIDHRQCGGCGVEGCTQARQRGLDTRLVEYYWSKRATNDKRGGVEAWERVLGQLCSGVPVIEGVTWQTVHLDLFPGLYLPARCPWSVSNPPPGWSLSSFTRHKLGRQIFKALQKGGAAAWNEMPDVRMDLNSLRFLEAVVFDDHRIDIEVMVWDDRGKVQIVELWGLFAMDVSTGAVIAFGLRPKLQREDGTSEGLTMRDMQHLIAHILATYGYPTKYPMQLIVENAAAAVSTHAELLLSTRSHGQVSIRRTGVHAGDCMVRGFPERWGAPRGKAVLESWFNLLDIALGDVKGQMGSNYIAKPGDHEGRVRIARQLAAVITARPELQRKLSAPLHWSGDAHLLVSEAIKAINARTDHAMKRHEQIVEWRWSEGDTTPKPLAIYAGMPAHLQREVGEFLQMPATTRAMLVNNYGCTRMESPTEKVQRIHRPQDFAAIPADTYLDLMMDSATATYKGGDVLDVETKRGKQKITVRFAGACQALTLGQQLQVRYNSDRPSAGAWLHDERHCFLTYLEFQRDPRMLHAADLPVLQAQLGAKNKAFAQTLNEARRIAGKLPERQQDLAERDRDLATLSTLNLEHAVQVAAALPESSNLARVVMATKRPQTAVPVSDADAYLELQSALDEDF